MAKHTKKDAQMILDTWQERLRLTHWEIELDTSGGMPEDISDAARAYVSTPDNYQHCTVGLLKGWQSETRRELNVLVVHELMHIHMRDWSRTANSMNRKGWIGQDAWTAISDRLDHEEEQFVDQMARILVDLGGVL